LDLRIFEVFLIIFLIVNSFIFSGTEAAILSLHSARLRSILDDPSKTMRILRLWHENPNLVLSSLLVGNNLVNISASTIATDLAYGILKSTFGPDNRLESVAMAIVIGVMTFLILVFGEIIPKTLGRTNPEKFLRLSGITYLYCRMFRWLSMTLLKLTTGIVKAVGGDINKMVSPSVTDRDLENMIKIGNEEGVIAEDKRELLESVLDFQEILVKEIMIPRTNIVALREDSSLDDMLKEVRTSKFSRYPVYRRNLDNITGVFFSKDIIDYLSDRRGAAFNFKDFVEKPLFIPETVKISDLLKQFQKTHTHLAVVVDEFGGTGGIITLEDVIEELVGEIYDEYDDSELPVKFVSEGKYLVKASYPLKDLEDQINISFPEQEVYDTVGGFVATEIGHVPAVGEMFVYKGASFIVRESDEKHVISVEINLNSADALSSH